VIGKGIEKQAVDRGNVFDRLGTIIHETDTCGLAHSVCEVVGRKM